MSTKIYNGYKLPNLSLKELSDFCKNNCAKLVLAGSKLAEADIVGLAVYFFDMKTFKKASRSKKLPDYIPDSGRGSLWDAFEAVKKEHEGRERAVWDYHCDIGFLQGRDKILALLYCDNKKLIKLWEKIEGVEEYGYWDNSDPPENIPYKEFKARGEEWDEALGPSFIPRDSCLVYEATHTLDLPCGKSCLKHVPSLEKRVETIARFILENNPAQYGFNNNEENVWSRLQAYKVWYNSEEGKAALEKAKAVAGCLKSKLTYEDLRG